MYLKNFITSGLFVLTFISLTAQNYQLKTKAISMQVNGNIKTGEKLHFTRSEEHTSELQSQR